MVNINNGEYSWYPDTNHGWIAEYLPKNDWAMDFWGKYVGQYSSTMVRIWVVKPW